MSVLTIAVQRGRDNPIKYDGWLAQYTPGEEKQFGPLQLFVDQASRTEIIAIARHYGASRVIEGSLVFSLERWAD